ESTADVRRLIHLRTEHLGPEELLVCAKVELESSLRFPEVAATINRLETELRRACPIAKVVYIEPDLYRSQPPCEGSQPSLDRQSSPTPLPACSESNQSCVDPEPFPARPKAEPRESSRESGEGDPDGSAGGGGQQALCRSLNRNACYCISINAFLFRAKGSEG
ncbi:MAG: hypothetical protein V2A73_15515, partial [Pseudomonadota bacterium]